MLTRVKLAYDDAGSGQCAVLIHGHPFDGAGHLSNLEAEEGFNEALLAFLRGHAPG